MYVLITRKERADEAFFFWLLVVKSVFPPPHLPPPNKAHYLHSTDNQQRLVMRAFFLFPLYYQVDAIAFSFFHG
jgi:hypothetical protein